MNETALKAGCMKERMRTLITSNTPQQILDKARTGPCMFVLLEKGVPKGVTKDAVIAKAWAASSKTRGFTSQPEFWM